MNTRTIKAIRIASGLIALIGAVVSYDTQAGLLLGWGVDALAAHAIPLTVDLLAIICALAIHTPDVDPAGRWIAYRVLFLTGVVSIAANGLAGHTIGSRVAHIWCVLAYLGAEAVAAKCKSKTAAVDPQLQAVRDELAAVQEQLAQASAALADAVAAAEQARTDAGRQVRAAQTKARKAIREAQAAAQPVQQIAPAVTGPARRLWTPDSPADLEAAYGLSVAPVSPAPGR